ncbi:MAG TPA: hypothetical protein VG452_01110, partial [Egibacteraceae bacterium]|nr:hypothetical protein [Egibacteraceae bacterium]
ASKTAAGGAAAGSAVGGTVGFLAGLAAFGVPGIGPALGAGIWATTLGGAAAGGGVGLAAAGYARIKESEAWALTHDQVSNGHVVVGVHSDDEDEVVRAAQVLSDHGPQDLNYFDAHGNRVDRG